MHECGGPPSCPYVLCPSRPHDARTLLEYYQLTITWDICRHRYLHIYKVPTIYGNFSN